VSPLAADVSFSLNEGNTPSSGELRSFVPPTSVLVVTLRAEVLSFGGTAGGFVSRFP
jgi:hypothetical protein